MSVNRPSFDIAWSKFRDVNVSVAKVGKKIGGKVQYNIDEKIFVNACPIRISYVLNYSGVLIPKAGYDSVSGADKKWYIYRVKDMMSFVTNTFGKPDKTVASPKPADFSGSKGLLIVKGHGWSDAAGHVTLWNGAMCQDSCHLAQDPDNGAFTPETASLWLLK